MRISGGDDEDNSADGQDTRVSDIVLEHDLLEQVTHKADFSTVEYHRRIADSPKPLVPVKGRYLDTEVWAIVRMWQETWKNCDRPAYIKTKKSEYIDYENIKAVCMTEGIGYDNCRLMCAHFWQSPRWDAYPKTIDSFIRHANTIIDDMRRENER